MASLTLPSLLLTMSYCLLQLILACPLPQIRAQDCDLRLTAAMQLKVFAISLLRIFVLPSETRMRCVTIHILGIFAARTKFTGPDPVSRLTGHGTYYLMAY